MNTGKNTIWLLPLLCICLFYYSEAEGQNVTLKQLQDSLSHLEQKVNRLDTAIRRAEIGTLPASRNDIENHRSLGFVITDVKGLSLRIGGFLQTDFMYDMRGMTNRNGFQPSTIVVPELDDGATNFSIRQSRLNFLASNPDKLFTALLELDLSGPEGTTAPRIRHAWISFGNWGFGQYWSNFTNNDTWPNLMDSWGPNAAIWSRQVQIRYTQKLNAANMVALSVEQPGADVTLPSDSGWTVRPLYPDVVGSYAFNWNKGSSHIKLSGLLHPVAYRTSIDNTSTFMGGAFNLSGNISTTGRDAVKFQVSYGTGYARYNEDLSGQGYDAVPDPDDGYKLRPVTQRYLWLFYDRWWSRKLSSTIGWGNITLDTDNYFSPEAVSSTNYGAVNLIWYPNSYFKAGMEIIYGNRKNANGEQADNLRVQFSAFVKL